MYAYKLISRNLILGTDQACIWMFEAIMLKCSILECLEPETDVRVVVMILV